MSFREKGYAIFGTIKTDQSVDNHTVSIKKVHIHPHYNAENNNNDIALFELTESLNIDNERPICLDTGTTLHNNLEVIATGFGVNKGN